MLKRIISVFMVSTMLVLSCAISAAADTATIEVGNDIVNFESDVYVTTNIAVAQHITPQKTYQSNNSKYYNIGCVAYVGKKSTNYDFNISKSGNYILTLYGYSSTNTKFYVKKGNDVISSLTVERDTIVNEWQFSPFYLDEGPVTLEIGADTNGATTFVYYYSIKYAGKESLTDFSKTEGAYKEHYLPTIIEAEYFDLGAEGHVSADNVNNGDFRPDDGINIITSGDGRAVELSEGEMTAYTFNVPVSADFDIYAATEGDADIEVEFNGYERKISQNIEKQTKVTEVLLDTVYLDAGTYTMKVFAKSELLTLDYIRFGSSKTKGASLNSEKVTETESETEEVPVYKTLYVSPNGSDDGDGTEGSPFATVNRAKEEVEKINKDMTGDIVVNILPGVYDMDETLVFTPESGGQNGYNVIFKGTDKYSQSVLSGGVAVTGWEKYDDVLYRADLDGVDDVRNLYINTYPAVRARSKYLYRMNDLYKIEGSRNVADGITVDSKNFPESFERADDMEIVSNYEWESHRYSVKDILNLADTHEKALLIDDVSANNIKRLGNETKSFYLENAMELLDEPGEFYYNSDEKKIYYYPLGNEDLQTAETYVAKKEQFVQIKGQYGNDVKNIVFDNIRFIYGACDAISKYGHHSGQSDSLDGHGDYQSGALFDEFRMNTGQFRMDYAKDIQIKNCEFINMGSSVIVMHDSVSDVLIDGNIIRDSSAGAIRIGEPGHKTQKAGVDVCSNITISNNVIARTSGEIYNNCAISVYYERDIKISNNDIDEMPYTGVSIGWGWENSGGYDHKNIEVSYNHIYKSMSLLKDGGAVYSLGEMKNSTIHDNYFEENGNRGLYNDAGSAYITSWNNVTTGGNSCIQVQKVQHLTHDIKVYNTYTNQPFVYQPGESDTITIEEPHLIEHGEPWPEEAWQIVENAGVLPQYENLKVRAEMPEWHPRRTMIMINDFFESKSSKEVQKLRGIYEAEDYMEGGEGVGYHKTLNPEPDNNSYRSEEVRLEYHQAVSSYVVATNEAGEWINYKVDIPADGYYFIDVHAKQTWTNGATTKIYTDEKLLTDELAIPNEEEYTTATTGPYYFSAGEHTVKIEFINSFYFDSFKIYGTNEVVIDDAMLYNTDADYDEGVYVYGTGHREVTEVSYDVPFTDIKDHWAGLTIRRLYRLGFVNGKSREIFAPNDNVKVYEALLLLTRGFKAVVTDEALWKEQALKHNIISIDTDTEKAITREEFAVMLMKIYTEKTGGFNITVSKDDIFKDMHEISEENKKYVIGAYEMGYILGDDMGNFNPHANITRAEASEILYRIINK